MNQGLFDFPSGLLLGGGTLKVQEFLTSGVWVKPPSVQTVYVFLVGGGGGGGGRIGTSADNGGSGGGGAEVVEKLISISGNLIITIGAGGNGGASQSAGSNGSPSSISGGAALTALQGGGGCSGDTINATLPTNILVANLGGSCSGNGNASGGAGFGDVTRVSRSNSPYNCNTNLCKYNPSPSTVDITKRNGGAGYKGFAGGGAAGSGESVGVRASGHSGGGKGGYMNSSDSLAADNNSGSGGGGAGAGGNAYYVGGNGGSGYCLIAWTE